MNEKFLVVGGIVLSVALGCLSLHAADIPVAEGYPVWQGVVDKSCFGGRRISPSDLRHKVTIVLEIEPNDKLQEQFISAAPFTQKVDMPGWNPGNWETLEIGRDVIFVISNRGGGTEKDHAKIKDALKYKGGDKRTALMMGGYRGMTYSLYDGLTFAGAPDTTGKRPFVYVMGPEGTEPICQGELNAGTKKEAFAAIDKALKQIKGWENGWRRFYGYVGEPKFHPQLAKTLEKGKTLEPVEKDLLKSIASKDPEKAKEAQVLFDAINQTRSDLRMRIFLEYADCPHRAYYDIQELLKYWPSEKKRIESVFTKLKAVPDAAKLAKIFIKLKTWGDPEFSCKNAGEAKKIVAELAKMKKDLAKLRESQVTVVQNGASIMDITVDELIGTIPTRVPSK